MGWVLAGMMLALPAQPQGRPVPAKSMPTTATVVFTDNFPGSQPCWFQVSITADGTGLYGSQQSANQPQQWLRVRFTPEDVSRVFRWARALDYFRQPRLEARVRVGFMGEKQLEYRGPRHQGEQKFNYTQVRAAAALAAWFQGVSETGEHRLRLRFKLRYDPLGVLAELNSIRRDWRAHNLAAPQLLSPLLQRIASDESMMGVARLRARGLLRDFRRRGKG